MLEKKGIGTKFIRPRFMRPKQAAVYLATSEATIWRLVQRGELPKPIKQGSRCSLFETAWLDAYADKLANGEGDAVC
ncbi:helix-turn-helix domain-containing protein [uncultured Mailhella sp.]|uniref:helix-turn-helix transcriptional regulator n=1 Tax=uncultured Mailhella sp. TaxID=1981031 RepID=UPI00320857FD